MKNIYLFLTFLFAVFSILSPAQSTVPCNGFNTWSSTNVYQQNAEAIDNGVLYQAQWYTVNQDPTQTGNEQPNGPWKIIGTCAVPITPDYVQCNGIPVWSSVTAYTQANIEVQYNNLLYKSLYYTENNEPDKSSAWSLVGTCITSTVTVTGSLTAFNEIVGGNSTPQSFSVSGTNLIGNVVITAPSGFAVSTTQGAGYSSTITLTPTSGTIASTTIYVIFEPLSVGTQTGNITIASTGLTTETIAVTGTSTSLWIVNGNNIYNTNSGNVGIGNTNPQYKLDVSGTANLIGLRVPTNAQAGYILTSDASGNATWQSLLGGQTSWNGSSLFFTAPAIFSLPLDIGSSLIINGGQPASGNPNPSIYNDGDNGSTAVLIQSATSTNGNTILNLLGGNVGIGLSNPQYKLDVSGGARLTSLTIPTGAGAGYVLTSDANGNATWQGTLSFQSGTAVFGGGINVGGTATLAGISIPTNAVAGDVLTSDANGNGTWQAIPPQTWTTSNGNIVPTSQLPILIGSTSPTNYPNYNFAVAGMIVSQQSIVSAPAYWADFVFDKNYKVRPLRETEAFVKKYHHLPSVPSEKEVKEKGFDLAEMDAKLLEKIEELYLHAIEQEKEIEVLKSKIKELQNK